MLSRCCRALRKHELTPSRPLCAAVPAEGAQASEAKACECGGAVGVAREGPQRHWAGSVSSSKRLERSCGSLCW